MRCEWDPQKAESNLRKHGVDFEVAQDTFRDPFSRIVPDQFELDEERLQITGLAGGHILVVVFVDRSYEAEEGDEIVRIISARRANRQERRDFEGRARAANS